MVGVGGGLITWLEEAEGELAVVGDKPVTAGKWMAGWHGIRGGGVARRSVQGEEQEAKKDMTREKHEEARRWTRGKSGEGKLKDEHSTMLQAGSVAVKNSDHGFSLARRIAGQRGDVTLWADISISRIN